VKHIQMIRKSAWHIPWYLDSLPHVARPTSTSELGRWDGCCCCWQNGGTEEERMGPPGPSSSQYGSWYSMSRTCGPRDIISLVIPRIGDSNLNRAFNSSLNLNVSLVKIIKIRIGFILVEEKANHPTFIA